MTMMRKSELIGALGTDLCEWVYGIAGVQSGCCPTLPEAHGKLASASFPHFRTANASK
jgi:hypothetical protein